MADVLVSLGILVVLATVAGLVANRLKLSPVLGLLAIGAIAGPNMLGWVAQGEVVDSFAELGAVLLLFTIGFEFSISKLFKYGKRSFFAALIKVSVVFFLAFAVSSAAGLDDFSAIAIGAIMAFTSTALMIKIIEQHSMMEREEIPLLLGMLIMEDIFAVIALTVVSGLGTGNIGVLAILGNIFWAIVILVAVFAAFFVAINKIFDWITQYQAKETMIFLALSIGLGFSYLAQYLGLSPSIGAFLAGSLVASLPRAKILEESINPFSLAFSSIFFISIGLLVNLGSIWSNIGFIAVICLANVLFQFAGTAISTYLFGFSGRQASFSGVAMLTVGEFSLLIAKETQSSASIDLLGITSALVFTSVIASSLLITRYNEIYLLISRLLPSRFKNAGRETAQSMHDLTHILERSRRASDLLGRNVLLAAGFAAALLFIGRAAIAQWSGAIFARLYGVIITTEWIVASGLLIAGIIILYTITRAFTQVGKRFGAGLSGRRLPEWELSRARSLAKIITLAIAVPLFLSLFHTSSLLRIGFVVLVFAAVAYWFSRGKNGSDGGRPLAFFKRGK